jgi:predicted alpha/beta-hydrolase family hydrolase
MVDHRHRWPRWWGCHRRDGRRWPRRSTCGGDNGLGTNEAILIVGALGAGLLDASYLCIGGRTGGGRMAALVGGTLGGSILGIMGNKFSMAHDRGC